MMLSYPPNLHKYPILMERYNEEYHQHYLKIVEKNEREKKRRREYYLKNKHNKILRTQQNRQQPIDTEQEQIQIRVSIESH